MKNNGASVVIGWRVAIGSFTLESLTCVAFLFWICYCKNDRNYCWSILKGIFQCCMIFLIILFIPHEQQSSHDLAFIDRSLQNHVLNPLSEPERGNLKPQIIPTTHQNILRPTETTKLSEQKSNDNKKSFSANPSGERGHRTGASV